MSGMSDAVTKPMLHISRRGYSISTTLLNEPLLDTSVSVSPLKLE